MLIHTCLFITSMVRAVKSKGNKSEAVRTEFQYHKWLPTPVIPTDRVNDQDLETTGGTRKDHIHDVLSEVLKDQDEEAEVLMTATEKDGTLFQPCLILNCV